MINVKSFEVNMLQENCYVVSDDSKECIIIDCGAYYNGESEAIISYIRDNNLTPVHLVGTHGHLDHHLGDHAIHEAFGLLPEVHRQDSELTLHLDRQAEEMFGITLSYPNLSLGDELDEDEGLSFGHHHFRVIHTPGHSHGSVCLYCEEEKVLFTGDTLFRSSIGRTDFKEGNMMLMIQSLRSLAQLPDSTVVYPGHGPSTTMGYELQTNPFLDR